MRDILPKLEDWLHEDEKVALATVVSTWGSSPRLVGSKMAMTASGKATGSVSAGCVESAVIEEAWQVLKSNTPRLLSFGVANEEAWEVGLVCGGTIQVFIEPFTTLETVFPAVRHFINEKQPFVLITIVQSEHDDIGKKLLVMPDGNSQGSIPAYQDYLLATAQDCLKQEKSELLALDDGTKLFIEVNLPPPRLIVIGAVHIGEALVSIANQLGFDTIVVDPRSTFATQERFPPPTTLIREWPQKVLPCMGLSSNCYVVVLTHDPKLDDPALQIALPSQATYVGALGSQQTNHLRISRLQKAGLPENEIARLHAPIGLDIGGSSPGEIAVSIMAEIILHQRQ